MKKIAVLLSSIVVLVFVLTAANSGLGDSALAQPPANEVVVLRCSVSASISGLPIVTSADSSVNAPTVGQGTRCAQGLSALLSDGFKIEVVESAGRPDGVTDLYYTLVSAGP